MMLRYVHNNDFGFILCFFVFCVLICVNAVFKMRTVLGKQKIDVIVTSFLYRSEVSSSEIAAKMYK